MSVLAAVERHQSSEVGTYILEVDSLSIFITLLHIETGQSTTCLTIVDRSSLRHIVLDPYTSTVMPHGHPYGRDSIEVLCNRIRVLGVSGVPSGGSSLITDAPDLTLSANQEPLLVPQAEVPLLVYHTATP